MAIALNDKQIELIHKRIEDTINHRKSLGEDSRAERNMRLYAGYHWNLDRQTSWALRDRKSEDFIVSNFIMAHCQIAKAATATTVPEFFVHPRSKRSVDNARFATALLNTIWRKISATRECQRVALDRYVFGRGILGIGWVTETIALRQEHTPFDPMLTDMLITDDAEVFRIDPRCFYVDPAAGDPLLTDARFVFWREDKPLSELMRISLEADISEEDISKATFVEERVDDPFGYSYYGDRKRVMVYHYWDRDEGIYVLKMRDKTDPLLVVENRYNFHGLPHPFPFEVLPFLEVPGSPYPQSMPEQMEDEQLMLNLTMKRLSAYIRSFIPKWVTNDSSAIDDDTRADLRSEEPLTIVRLSGTKDASLVAMQPPTMPPEVWNYIGRLLENMSVRTGLMDYQRADTPQRRETAAVGKIRAIMGGVRSAEQAYQYKDFIYRVAQKLLRLYQDPAFGGNTREVIFIRQDTAEREILEGDYTSVAGDWDIEVVVGSKMLEDRESQKEMAALLLNVTAPLIQSGEINPTPILRKLFEAWEVADWEDILLQKDVGKILGFIKQMPDDAKQILAQILSSPQLAAMLVAQAQQLLMQQQQPPPPSEAEPPGRPGHVRVPRRKEPIPGVGIQSSMENLGEMAKNQMESGSMA